MTRASSSGAVGGKNASSSGAVGAQGRAAFVSDTAAIVDGINAMADSLAPELLPNGRRNGTRWMFSGIADHGQSESAWINLSGARIGHWVDMGNAATGEERGDMIDLLRLKLGLDQAGAFDEARRRLGMMVGGERRELSQEEKQRRAAEARARAEAQEAQAQAEREKKAKRARALWLGAKPITGTPAEWYLRGRGLRPNASNAFPGSLRFIADAWHGELRRHNPAMVCNIMTRAGVQIGTHRVFLERRGPNDWIKLRGAMAKMVLGNMWGGFIPINKGSSGKPMSDMPAGEPVYMCEGPEDAVALRMIKPEARIICAISLPNMGAILLPDQCRDLVMVADRDDKPAANDALEWAIAMQQARGMQVATVMPPAEVNGFRVKDINDWVQALSGIGERVKEGAA